MSRYPETDPAKLKRYKAANRLSKVDFKMFAKAGDAKLSDFWSCVPDVLKAGEMLELLETCFNMYKTNRPIIFGLGGHVIKCGLAPLLIEMMRLKVVHSLAVNGSVIIHDWEIAMCGKTSEDAASAVEDGSFGMAADTADDINAAIKQAQADKLGLGEAIGKTLAGNAKYKEHSLLANAYELGIPVSVHVAIGTDIIHMHASADGAAIGETSLRDFRIFCGNLQEMEEGGVFINFGSSVIIPEVFIKALSVVRNLGLKPGNLTTAVFDMNTHYRPMVNIVQRPVLKGGKGYYFVGHHELMIPLFLLSLKERILS